MIFDVRRFHTGEVATTDNEAEFSYIVAVRGNHTYTLWSRYIENIDIIIDPDKLVPRRPGTDESPQITVSNYENGSIVLFSPIGRKSIFT